MADEFTRDDYLASLKRSIGDTTSTTEVTRDDYLASLKKAVGAPAPPELIRRQGIGEKLLRRAYVMGGAIPGSVPPMVRAAQMARTPEEAAKIIEDVATFSSLAAGGLGTGAGVAAAGALKVAAPVARSLLVNAVEGAIGGAAAGAVHSGMTGGNVPLEIGGGALGGAVLSPAIGVAVRAGQGIKAFKGIAKTLTELPETVDEVMTSVPKLGTSMPAVAEKTRALQAASAREAFRKLVPEGKTIEDVGPKVYEEAKRAARRAARTFTPPTADELIQKGNALQGSKAVLADSFDPTKQEKPKLFYGVWSQWVRDVSSSLRKDKAAFGSVGPEFADMLEQAHTASNLLEGKRTTYLNKLLRGLSREQRLELDKLIRNEISTASSAKVAQAAAKFRMFDDQVYAEAVSHGVKELDQSLTARYNALPESDKARFASMVNGRTANSQSLPLNNLAAEAISQDATVTGDAVLVKLRRRANHAPQYYHQSYKGKVLKQGSPERIELQNKLIRAGQAKNREEASAIIEGMFEDNYRIPAEIRGGPMQFSRELLVDTGFERDPARWMPLYSHQTSRRLASAAVFGGSDEKFKALSETLREQGGDTRRLKGIWNAFIGRTDPHYLREAQLLGNIATVSMLGPKTALLQFMQLSNTAGAMGSRNTAAALITLLASPAARKFIKESGSILPSASNPFDTEAPTRVTNWWIKFIQMQRTDRAVRAISAVASGIRAKQVAEEYAGFIAKAAARKGNWLTRGKIGELERELLRFGLDPAEVRSAGGVLNEAQTKIAMLNGAKGTQFASQIIDLPEKRTSPMGRFIYKFKSFTLQQARYIDNYIMKEAYKGNLKPLVRYSASLYGLHEAVGTAIDKLSGVPAQDKGTLEEIRSLLYVGALGAWGDFALAASSSDRARLLDMLVGPSVSQAAGLTTAVTQTAQGKPANWKRLTPAVIRNIQNVFKEE